MNMAEVVIQNGAYNYSNELWIFYDYLHIAKEPNLPDNSQI